MRTARFFIGFVLLVVAALASRRADAFCRTRTVDVGSCNHTDENGCSTCGHATWWKSACVGFDVQRDASRKIPYDQAAATVARAFANWTQVRCGANNVDGAHADSIGSTDATEARVSIDAYDLGPVRCDQAQYNESGGPNQNVVVFHDDAWPHKTAHEAAAHLASPDIALTTITYDKTTGEIWDADIEINTAEHTIVISNTPAPGTFDLESILTHEVGHFFGIAHSPQPDAVMYYQDEGGSSKRRNLEPDDIAAICTIYPPGGQRAVDPSVSSSGLLQGGGCDPTPRHGFTSDCSAPSSKGCSVGSGAVGAVGGGGGGARFEGAAGLSLTGIFLALMRRRARRSTASTRAKVGAR